MSDQPKDLADFYGMEHLEPQWGHMAAGFGLGYLTGRAIMGDQEQQQQGPVYYAQQVPYVMTPEEIQYYQQTGYRPVPPVPEIYFEYQKPSLIYQIVDAFFQLLGVAFILFVCWLLWYIVVH